MHKHWRHFVYLHRRADTGSVFYVGKGTVRKRCNHQACERAASTTARSSHWHRVVARHGFIIEVVASFRTDVDAQEFERALIVQYGRDQLVNLTDGGDGHAGIETTAELRRIRSVNASRPRSPAWITAIRAARKNGGNGGVVKMGDKLPAPWRQAIAASKRGSTNPMHGRRDDRHPSAKAVIDTVSGQRHPTITAAARSLGMRTQALHNMLTGFRPNSTTMRLA